MQQSILKPRGAKGTGTSPGGLASASLSSSQKSGGNGSGAAVGGGGAEGVGGVPGIASELDRSIILKAVLHVADISNPCKPWDISKVGAMPPHHHQPVPFLFLFLFFSNFFATVSLTPFSGGVPIFWELRNVWTWPLLLVFLSAAFLLARPKPEASSSVLASFQRHATLDDGPRLASPLFLLHRAVTSTPFLNSIVHGGDLCIGF